MADKLLPCSFCGGEATLVEDIYNDQLYNYVICSNDDCNANTERCDTEDEAITKWNNRPSPWHTGTPTEKEIDKDNQYCYALCFYYDGWWLSDYLFKANHEEGCFENSPNNGQQVCKFSFCDNIAWQKIDSYKED